MSVLMIVFSVFFDLIDVNILVPVLTATIVIIVYFTIGIYSHYYISILVRLFLIIIFIFYLIGSAIFFFFPFFIPLFYSLYCFEFDSLLISLEFVSGIKLFELLYSLLKYFVIFLCSVFDSCHLEIFFCL